MLQMEDEEHFSCDGTAQEDIETSGKKTNFAHNEGFECLQHFQTMNKNESRYGNDCHDEIRSILLPKTNLVEKDAKLYSNTECPNDSPNIISDIDETNFQDSLINQIRRLEDRKPLWINTGVRKSTSPCILARLGKAPVYMTIDEGSEVNCIDESFAARNAVTFVPTKCRATAAGSTNMILAGQTKEDIVLTFDHNKEKVILFVGKMIVVKNLGVNILLGEPGKRDNAIVTIPHERMVEFSSDKGKRIRVPYTSSQENIPATEVFHCKALKNDTIYSDHTLTIQLPIHMRKNKCVVLTNKNTSQYPGIKSKILPVNNGMVSIKNESAAPIKLSKHEHFADIHTCSNISFHNEMDKINKVYCLDREDFSHLVPFETKESLETQDYTNEIVIDPDKILPEHWRNRFMTICREYADIITPKPGKYNGFYGLVDNSINFSNIPPPSVRAHLPKYSHEMLVIMGEKMDQLERWGVLRKPEDLGIVPEFVLASMLQPKPDSGDWRLVTDFTPLNIHIKKLETISPTISEAKEKLAKYRYHIQLDLSNYFYQGGMKIKDIQFLATPHSFKGLRVYTCEPQGLKNASEHAYERLGRVYGDLCASERMTRMADGLYILADNLKNLEENFIEVLQRARLCGFTFKPSKIVIAPLKTVLFGWNLTDSGWRPTSHTITPLIKAELPVTVKQARSWIGSYKQISDGIPNHAILLGPLESSLGGKASAERIVWTQDLINSFEECKKSLNNIQTIHVPKPSDQLHTYSDYSKANRAVGGRLEIHRMVNGVVKKLTAGHFSCRVNKHQAMWHPCEGEGLAVRLVLEHFSHYIRENKNKTIHHTDNQPVVQAWKRSKAGAFSASARIATFLSGVSAMNVEVIHTPGKDLKTSDYNSRNPESCHEERCQICKFANEMQNIGDRVAKISVADINEGRVTMPFNQRAAWLKVQKEDKIHQQLSFLINNSLSPEKRKTKGDNTIIKRLHNLYKLGKLSIAHDGLITVTYTDPYRGPFQAISIPLSMYPGLIQALHLKLDHPSKLQLQKIAARHFYSPGYARVIEEVVNNCSVCAALKKLPNEVTSQSTEKVETFGSNFSSDVLRMHNQKIFITREKLSQFTMATFIQDETAKSFKQVLLLHIAQLIPETGAKIQVDCATACQALKAETDLKDSILNKLGVQIDLGRTFNKNKNPVIENAIKEFHKEHLRINPNGGPISETELILIVKNMNSRIRYRGLSAKEILLQRDQISHENRPVSDNDLSEEQYKKRSLNHPKETITTKQDFTCGDIVFLKADVNKLRGREMYRIVDIFQKQGEQWAFIQKTEKQFRSKKYEVKLSEVFLVPGGTGHTLDPQEHESDITEKEVPLYSDENTVSTNEHASTKENKQDRQAGAINTPTFSSEDAHQSHKSARKPRKAAIKCSVQVKDLASRKLLNIKTSEKKQEPPRHAWDYDQFCLLLEEHSVVSSRCSPIENCQEDTGSIRDNVEQLQDKHNVQSRPLTSEENALAMVEEGIAQFEQSWEGDLNCETEILTEDNTVDENNTGDDLLQMSFTELNNLVQESIADRSDRTSLSLQWDESPEQYLLESSEEEASELFRVVSTSTPLFPARLKRLQANKEQDYDDTLTSEEDNDEVFFHDIAYLDLTTSETRFTRSRCVRKKRPTDIQGLQAIIYY